MFKEYSGREQFSILYEIEKMTEEAIISCNEEQRV